MIICMDSAAEEAACKLGVATRSFSSNGGIAATCSRWSEKKAKLCHQSKPIRSCAGIPNEQSLTNIPSFCTVTITVTNVCPKTCFFVWIVTEVQALVLALNKSLVKQPGKMRL